MENYRHPDHDTHTSVAQELYAEILSGVITKAQKIAVFTGAGISAESGIATFRDPATGALWSKFDPEVMSSMAGFEADPQLVWDWNEALREKVLAATPNLAHQLIASLEKNKEVTVITQNVDDLHERAGSTNVLHLHGKMGEVSCTSCDFDGIVADTNKVDGNMPACPRCGGLCRPKVVWFGEQLPQGVWRDSVEAIRACDVLFIIGTSGQVNPAASLPNYMPFDKHTISINTRKSDHPGHVYQLTGKASEMLSLLLAK